MIIDDDIDLTPERKFNEDSAVLGVSDKAACARRKLFPKRNNHSSLFYSFVKPSTELPWNVKAWKSERDKPKRSYFDPLSDDFGATIRVTEDNTIMCLADTRINNLVLEEYLLETLGVVPYNNIGVCYECGRKRICSVKEEFSLALCESHKIPELPWRNVRRRIG